MATCKFMKGDGANSMVGLNCMYIIWVFIVNSSIENKKETNKHTVFWLDLEMNGHLNIFLDVTHVMMITSMYEFKQKISQASKR